ncbi:DUF1552 domain-containing protein [Sandaracinus amylolyticus]|uniref:DUF1552 domain-containing protein n=1 Tax=Sandaracinus amylolyticus TaxID=927083 RepID=UPI001F1FEC11|nr:DUF1552 domain-containing protein [Sandaracinus amylolyticus]UJR81237.1 Hypothetical protein I5071_32930 [Sandaracinus amylolyticus]
MTRFRLDRRTMLKGMLGGAAVSIALPTLDVFLNDSGTAYADCGALPVRFGWWFFGNGVIPELWVPQGTGRSYVLPEQTAPLEPMREKISFVTGTRVMTPNTSPHGSGPAGLLAGGDMTSSYPGPTIDQIVAEADGFRGATRFRSLEIGVQRATTGLSHSGPDAVNPPECSPAALFERLFGAGFRAPGETTEPDPRLALRRSVLDAVTGQARRLQSRVGARDRQRIEEHLDGIRAIETQIARLQEDPPNLAACMRPTAPTTDYPDLEGRPQMSAISRVMSDLCAMALACDQTRVFSVMFSQPVNNTLFLDTTAGHHQLTHDEPGNPQPEVNRVVTFVHEEMAYFLSALDRIVEGDGTLLDHAAVLCTTDVSFGRTHSIENYPLVIAGGACGALRTGIHHAAPGANATSVSLSLMRAVGLNAAEFGFGVGRATDGLSEIEV